MKVTLIKSITPELPIGSTGEVIDGRPEEHGMSLVRWDNGMVIPMFNGEIKPGWAKGSLTRSGG